VQAALRPGARALKKPSEKATPRSPKPAKLAGAPRKASDDPFRIVHAAFLAGAAPGSSLPAPSHAEIAFAGRSNVGKSSLINTLTSRSGLVRTSSTPGSTRQINLFEARAADGTVLHLIDLPGYGFSKRSKGERREWASLIDDYVSTRSTLAAVVLIVDVRRGLEEDDRDLITFVETAQAPSRRPVKVILVATKLDKEPSSRRKTALVAVEKAAGRQIIGFSSETAEGRDTLLRAMRRAAFGTTNAGSDSTVATTTDTTSDTTTDTTLDSSRGDAVPPHQND
jgi:GTP-binding protein